MFRLTIFFILNMASICTWAQSETIDTSAVPPPLQEKPEKEVVENLIEVEQQAEFPNGTAALYRWLIKKIKYPETAYLNRIEGTVVLTFIIEKDGSVSNINVLREVGGGCTEEAIRVIKKMPKWKPGKHDGHVVKVKYTLPVHFKLDKKIVNIEKG